MMYSAYIKFKGKLGVLYWFSLGHLKCDNKNSPPRMTLFAYSRFTLGIFILTIYLSMIQMIQMTLFLIAKHKQ